MKISRITFLFVLLSFTSRSQEISNLSNKVRDKQDAYTKIGELKVSIKLADGYVSETHNGFISFINKKSKSRIQYMKLDMNRDDALDEVMVHINSSEKSKVIHEDYMDVDGYESFLFTVLDSSGKENRLEFYLITPYLEGALVFKGSAPDKNDVISEIMEMITSIKRGF